PPAQTTTSSLRPDLTAGEGRGLRQGAVYNQPPRRRNAPRSAPPTAHRGAPRVPLLPRGRVGATSLPAPASPSPPNRSCHVLLPGRPCGGSPLPTRCGPAGASGRQEERGQEDRRPPPETLPSARGSSG